MTSREDSFPLVNLEAGIMKKPVLCFEDSGGSVEFVSNNCGVVSPYLDIEHMANKIVELYNNKELMETLGFNAHEKVVNELNTNVQANKIFEILKQHVPNSVDK